MSEINAYEIQTGLDPLGMFPTSVSEDWQPRESEYARLGELLPFDWPERYRQEFDQFFNPWTYRQNAAALCGFVTSNGRSVELDVLAQELFDRMLNYTVVDRNARFVIYSFEYSREETTMKPGWVSAFGNGVVLAGTVALHECFVNPDYLDAAWELYGAFTLLKDDDAGDRWITERLEDGSLWFEEYPLEEDPQPRVLNGHILGVLGLYYLYESTGDETVLQFLQSGITAVARHVEEYRRPGEINLYDLRSPDLPDYGPARTIAQQDQLCQISLDPIFLEYRNLFAQDMPEAAETVELTCEIPSYQSRRAS